MLKSINGFNVFDKLNDVLIHAEISKQLIELLSFNFNLLITAELDKKRQYFQFSQII